MNCISLFPNYVTFSSNSKINFARASTAHFPKKHKNTIHMKTPTKGHNLTVKVNDIDLSYDDVGEGSIPIVFLHGFPFDKTMWQEQLDYLKNTHRVIAIDIRGFGKSRDEESHLSMDLFANDLILFIYKLALDKVIIC